MTYEINLAKKQQEREDKKKKSITLKATTKEEKEVEEEKQSKKDEDLTLITIKFNKFMKGEKFKGRRFTSRKDSFKKESSSHGDKERWEEKRDLVCFKCKKLGHIKYDCPLYKSKAKMRKRKAMMATWSESENESSKEENEKEVTNMCLMAIDELDEVNSIISDEDIHDAFQELYEDFEKLGWKNIFLKKKVQQLEKELGEVKEKFSNVKESKTYLEKKKENMCFMEIDELDEVNSNISYKDIHDAFEELYENFEKLGLKNAFLKKKVQQHEKELGKVKE